MVSAALMAPGAVREERGADWAVTELYSLQYWPLVRLAVLLVRDVPTAEDVVQDSFVAMYTAGSDCGTLRTRWPICGR
jgi:DNA-directed RNA polymerase specialized sigma24 family protein